MINKLILIGLIAILSACKPAKDERILVTVDGEMPASEIGMTLTHEHVLVDFIGADSTGYHRWDRSEVVRQVLPHLMELKEFGYRTMMECTPAYIGRDPVLLKILSDSSGLNLLTNTGYYGAANNQYLPDFVYRESAGELAERWIAEWVDGIEDTGIKPGFIKIGVAGDSLSSTHEKLVRAAAITHLETGLVIASHTGPAKLAFREMEILKEEGVSAQAFIWVHAQQEKEYEKYKEAALQGAWVSLDGVSENNITDYIERLDYMRSQDLLNRVIISHDAGWYRPGEPGGGQFRPFTAIHEYLVPALLQRGFTDEEVQQLLIGNPASAFSISVRMRP